MKDENIDVQNTGVAMGVKGFGRYARSNASATQMTVNDYAMDGTLGTTLQPTMYRVGGGPHAVGMPVISATASF